MPEWLIWMVAIWFFFGVMGRRRCGWTAWGPYRLPGSSRSRSQRHPLPRTRGASRPAARSPARPEETAEERLRRRFVEGRIDLDRYEAELWEELRPKR